MKSNGAISFSNSNGSDSSIPKGLVLSGGGARGAYQIGVYKFLEEVGWEPDILAGTSIGAINAGAIASGHTADSLWQLFRNLTNSDVHRLNNPLSCRRWSCLFDNSALKRTLVKQGWFKFDHININSTKKLRITAVEKETGKLRIFGAGSGLSPVNYYEEVTLNIDHIMASCSIPFLYPPVSIEKTWLWDGAVIANTPIGPVVDAGAKNIIIVLMTPWPEKSSSTRHSTMGCRSNLLDILRSVIDVASLSYLQAYVENLRKMGHMERLLIIAPHEPLPLSTIVNYGPSHEQLYKLGYDDAKRAWSDRELANTYLERIA